jgi:hypothetical protein
MKKVFLLFPLLTIFAFPAFAQSFSLSNSNGPLTHDTIVDVYASASVELIEERVYITNNSDEDLKLLVKKEELEILEGTMNTFCFNGLCFPPHVFQAPYVLTLEPGQTSGEYDFYGDYYPFGQVGSTLIRYTIFDPENVEDSVSVRIRYNTIEGGFTLSDHNGLLTHDTMLVFNGSPDDMLIQAHVFITNTSSDTIHFLVKKEDIEQLENTFNTFCWIDLCYPPDVVLSPVALALAPGATTSETDFYGDYIPNGQEGITIVRYTIFNQDVPADSISVIFKFNTSNVGIGSSLNLSEKIISKPYPNPASSIVHFDIDIPSNIRDAIIVIRNLLGSEVMRYAVNPNSGRVSLPVSHLKEGFYFYTLNVEDNYPVQTGRMIIKR